MRSIERSETVSAWSKNQELLDLATQRHYLIRAAHIAFPGLGHVRPDGGGYRWVPLNYDAVPARRAAR